MPALRTTPMCYAVSLASVLLAWLATTLLQTVTQHKPLSLLLFFAAVAVSSGIGGLKAGVFATILSAVICDFFFLPPYYSLTVARSEAPLLILFVVVALLINGLSERLHAQTRRSERHSQELSRKLVNLQETERRDIARELHDEIGQLLTGLKYSLEVCARQSGQPAKDSLREPLKIVEDLMQGVRELSLDLRPAMLDDLGLLPTLIWHFDRYTAQTGIRVDFEHSGLDRRFEFEAETTAFRIVQETLTNAARHAGVEEVAVRVWSTEALLEIQVVDRGKGFDPDAALGVAVTGGLAGMKERAELLGGRLTIESKPGSGTFVSAQIPTGPAADK